MPLEDAAAAMFIWKLYPMEGSLIGEKLQPAFGLYQCRVHGFVNRPPGLLAALFAALHPKVLPNNMVL
ncbi:hypothetical protein MUK42_28204 [Musa troglodytarum]|uniref:Uncharacterized protein n=1 Tax=Musa troglodytarum TaxID=320322 RepID=A0A9E7JZS8_9LILI|nr:hypothetical protein MUK42_28204 [Musa troglodytarum]